MVRWLTSIYKQCMLNDTRTSTLSKFHVLMFFVCMICNYRFQHAEFKSMAFVLWACVCSILQVVNIDTSMHMHVFILDNETTPKDRVLSTLLLVCSTVTLNLDPRKIRSPPPEQILQKNMDPLSKIWTPLSDQRY